MSHSRFRATAPLVTILLALTAPACFLAGPVPPNTWEAAVEPQSVCPGEPVTVTWNAGPWDGCMRDGSGGFIGHDADCGHSTRIAVRSTPDGIFAADPIDPRETAGTRTINPTETTSISFSATGRNSVVSPLNFVVNVMTEENEGAGFFAGVCDGNSPTWSELPLSRSGVPESAELVQLCNPNLFRVSLDITTATGTNNVVLGPNGGDDACIDSLSDVTRVVGSTRDATVLAGAMCTPQVESPPNPIRILGTWACP